MKKISKHKTIRNFRHVFYFDRFTTTIFLKVLFSSRDIDFISRDIIKEFTIFKRIWCLLKLQKLK